MSILMSGEILWRSGCGGGNEAHEKDYIPLMKYGCDNYRATVQEQQRHLPIDGVAGKVGGKADNGGEKTVVELLAMERSGRNVSEGYLNEGVLSTGEKLLRSRRAR